MIRAIRFAGRRIRVAVLTATMLLAVLAPMSGAHASVTYRCTFGPVGVNDYNNWMIFHSHAGVGNDDIRFQGLGTCSDGVPIPYNQCRLIAPFCPLLRSFPAVIVGSDADLPTSSAVHVGRCDADVSPYGSGTQNKLMIPHANIHIGMTINGQVKGYDMEFQTYTVSNNPDWPGALPVQGQIFDLYHQTVSGTIAIASRINGQCPPSGTPTAWYSVTFTEPA